MAPGLRRTAAGPGRRASTAAGESVIAKGFHVRLRCGVDRPTQELPVPLPVASVGHGRGDPHDQVVVDPQQIRVEQVVKVGTQEKPVGHDVRRRTVKRLDVSRLQSLTGGNTTDGAPASSLVGWYAGDVVPLVGRCGGVAACGISVAMFGAGSGAGDATVGGVAVLAAPPDYGPGVTAPGSFGGCGHLDRPRSKDDQGR